MTYSSPVVRGALELEVVDLAAQRAVAVAQLAVEQVEGGVERRARSAVMRPALVMIISGIVATATTTRMTRYTMASALRSRPLVCSSPM